MTIPGLGGLTLTLEQIQAFVVNGLRANLPQDPAEIAPFEPEYRTETLIVPGRRQRTSRSRERAPSPLTAIPEMDLTMDDVDGVIIIPDDDPDDL